MANLPFDDASAHDQTDPGVTNPNLDPGTVAMTHQTVRHRLAQEPDPESTQPLTVGEPTAPEPEPKPVRAPRSYLLLGALGLVGVVILGAATASFFLRTNPVAAVTGHERPEPTAADMPPVLRPYYDRAITGDASAMRMLGTMYYNGLNVPRDSAEGIRWYRKAATAGSVAARKDLEQLGLSTTGK